MGRWSVRCTSRNWKSYKGQPLAHVRLLTWSAVPPQTVRMLLESVKLDWPKPSSLLCSGASPARTCLADMRRDGRPEIILRMAGHRCLPWCWSVGARAEGQQDLAEPASKKRALPDCVVCHSHKGCPSSI